MVNFGLYLITGHPLEHNINVRWPATDPEPEGYCVDCKKHVDVRWIHPGWLDRGILETDIDLEDLGLGNGVHLDERREPSLRHKGYIMATLKTMSPGATSKEIFHAYRLRASVDDETPRSYRRVTQLLAELEKDGAVTSRMANRGTRGRSRIWEVV